MATAQINPGIGSGGKPPGSPSELAIRSQLERMLASPLFNQSRRYSSLLRYVVENSLENGGPPKERTIGCEVFGRDPAYDTSADPVVRTTAAQLRRRIAQYYQQVDHSAELVISLPPGGYHPEFRWPAEEMAAVTEAVPVEPERKRHWLDRGRWVALIAATVIGLGAGLFILLRPGEPALTRFWKPVWNSPQTVLVVIGVPRKPPARDPALPEITIGESLHDNSVAWPDAMTIARVTGVLASHGRAYALRKSSETSFADLKEGPTVLVGGFNNIWIRRLGSSLRFSYELAGEGIGWIRDSYHPERKDWHTDVRAPFSTFTRDYGVVTRLMEPTTGRILVIASGIASYGTIAAGDFLSDEKLMEMLDHDAPAGWGKKNMQVVFSTSVVNGSAGPPQILAVHVW
ncbi:MAG TPA: hypothetical protein VN519_02505 [Bryobacteraceae bacterium]|nr:hypothetical protein [Bryobacteraceae bacterium]